MTDRLVDSGAALPDKTAETSGSGQPPDDVQDRRARRSRQALTEAFLDLVVERPYADIRIADVIARAGVGRSTFYEHYANKDDILRRSLTGAFDALADLTGPGADVARLTFWLERFWESRPLGRVLLNGPTRAVLVRTLAGLVESRLAVRGDAGRLVAWTVAEAQLGLISAWLNGVAASDPGRLGLLLARQSRALAEG